MLVVAYFLRFFPFPIYSSFVFIKVVVMPVLPLKPFLAYKQNEFRVGGNPAEVCSNSPAGGGCSPKTR